MHQHQDCLGQPIKEGDRAVWSGKFISNGLIEGTVKKVNAKMIGTVDKKGIMTYTLYPRQLLIINNLHLENQA